MADELVVGKLKALLGLDTAAYEAGARKATAVNKTLAGDLKKTRDEVAKFAVDSRNLTFKEMIAGMTAAGKAASSSAQLIKGMSAAGKEAAAVQLEMARAAQRAADVQQAAARSSAAAWAAARKQDAERVASFQQQAAAAQTLGQRISALAPGLKSLALGLGVGIGVGAVTNAIRSFASFASHMEDLSAETGIGIERLQQFNYVAVGVGLSIDDVTSSINMLTHRVASGDDSAIAALERLGISAEKFLDLSGDEKLLTLADAFGKVSDQTERTALAYDVLGRNGPRALRLLNAELRELVENAPKIDKELIKQAGRLDDLIEQGWLRFEATAVTAIDTVVAHLSQLAGVVGGPLAQNLVKIAKSLATGSDVPSVAGMEKPGLPPVIRVHPATESEQKKLDRQLDESMKKRASAEADAERRAAQKRAELNAYFTMEIEQIAERQKAETDAAKKLAAEEDERLRNATEVDNATLEHQIRTNQKRLDDEEQFLKDQGEVENAALERWGKAYQAQVDANKERLKELREAWLRVADDITFSITDGFADMLVGLRSFRDSFIGIWRDIRRVVAGILSQMLADFIGGYVRRAVAAMAGTAVAGATIGAGTAAAAGVGAAAAAGGAGAGAGAAAAGASGGIGATIAGLATNPFTIAAAAGIGLSLLIGKKGLFRGGEEGTQVNPRRDRFIGQFGPSGTGPGSGFANLAALLKGTSLFAALTGADSVGEFEAAQSGIVRRLGARHVQSFNMGGFVPPGVVQPAILHGGARGEVVIPLDKVGSAASVTHIHNWTVQAWDGQDAVRAIRNVVIPELNNAAQRNTGGYTTEHRKGFGIKPAYGAR